MKIAGSKASEPLTGSTFEEILVSTPSDSRHLVLSGPKGASCQPRGIPEMPHVDKRIQHD